jgi:hypothetical protein
MMTTDIVLVARLHHENVKQLHGVAGHCAARLETVNIVSSTGVLTYIDGEGDPEDRLLLTAIQLLKQHLLGSETTIAHLLDEVEIKMYEDDECLEHSNSNFQAARS